MTQDKTTLTHPLMREDPQDDADPAKDALIEYFLSTLNGALAADRAAMSALLAHRVPCNEDMQNHPTIQVVVEGDGDTPGEATLGVLGLINGLVGIRPDGWGYITLVCDDETDEPIKFVRTRR
jgi:hypothetical protein